MNENLYCHLPVGILLNDPCHYLAVYYFFSIWSLCDLIKLKPRSCHTFSKCRVLEIFGSSINLSRMQFSYENFRFPKGEKSIFYHAKVLKIEMKASSRKVKYGWLSFVAVKSTCLICWPREVLLLIISQPIWYLFHNNFCLPFQKIWGWQLSMVVTIHFSDVWAVPAFELHYNWIIIVCYTGLLRPQFVARNLFTSLLAPIHWPIGIPVCGKRNL